MDTVVHAVECVIMTLPKPADGNIVLDAGKKALDGGLRATSIDTECDTKVKTEEAGILSK